MAGYHRRILITPSPGVVTAALEDDFHCMSVTISHDGTSIMSAKTVMERAPWTTCPGAPAMLAETFTGVALGDAASRGAKPSNCTHLHDLALLSAAHASDAEPTRYDIFVGDPVDGIRVSELRRDDALLLCWQHRDDVLESPEPLRGLHILKLRDWIQSLDAPEREAARLLQWASLVAHGRTVPMERQMDATRMPPNCFTFQPERAAIARRVGKIIDFNAGGAKPLDHFDGTRFAARLVA